MKKSTISRIILFILFFLFIIFTTASYAIEITLEQIIELFNNSSFLTDYKEDYNMEYFATIQENQIIITGYNNLYMVANLENNILTIEGNNSSENKSTEIFFAQKITDCIGQLQGYAENDLYVAVNSQKIFEYTLENDGLQFSQTNDDWKYEIDITKKIPLPDFNDVYFSTIEFYNDQQYLNILMGDGSFQMFKDHINFYKRGNGKDVTLYIGETSQNTSSSYKSILSAIEVMFGSKKAANYFELNYPDISIGNKSFDGITVEINPELDSFESNIFDIYSVMKVTIDKDIVNTQINNIPDEQLNNSQIADDIQNTVSDSEISENVINEVENTVDESEPVQNTITDNNTNTTSNKTNTTNITYLETDSSSNDTLILLLIVIIVLLFIFFLLLFMVILKYKNM